MRISGNAGRAAWCRRVGQLALIGLITSTTWADSLPSRAVQSSPALKISERPVLLAGTSAHATRFQLEALSSSPAPRPSALRQKLLAAGVGRSLPWQALDVATLTWASTDSGLQFAAVEWRSPGAAAVRLQLAQAKLPSGMRFYLYAPAHPEAIYGPYSASTLRSDEAVWLPAVEGDTVRIEIQASLVAGPPRGHLRMASLSHLTRSIRDDLQKSLSELDQAGSCNIDIACPPSDAQWRQYGQSVAKYYLTEDSGDTFICTGTLLNSSGPAPLPDYFLTASHCVSTPSVAASMQFFWFFQRATCGGPAPTSVTESFGGATLLSTVAANDMTLVRLNAPPPAGTTRAGWSSDAITAGDTVMTLHHPSGDLKKFSRGVDQGFSDYGSTVPHNDSSHIRIQWNTGTTEGGSSGAGLFNEAGQLVGTLNGGGASCTTPTAPDWYGRFDQAYTTLRDYLMPATSTPPPPPPAPSSTLLTSGSPVSAVVNQGSSSFYRIATTADSTRLTVSLTALSADGDLYVYRDSPSSAPTCSSTAPAQTEEMCVIDAPGAATWLIEVNGNESISFSVAATVESPAPSTPTVSPTSNRRRGGGGGGSMTTALLGALALLALLRACPRDRWRSLLRVMPIAAIAASLGCTGTPTAATAEPLAIVLAPPTATELGETPPASKGTPLKVGFGREVPVAERSIALDRLVWTRAAVGVTTSVSVRSTGARSMRVALRLEHDYPGLQITLHDRNATLIGSTLVRPEATWSPVIPGDTVILHLAAPTLPPSGTVLEVPRVSHLQ